MFDRIKLRWRALFRREELERELEAELRFHLERETARNLRNGMNPDDAHYSALKSFGPIERSKEGFRDVRGVRLIEEFVSSAIATPSDPMVIETLPSLARVDPLVALRYE